MVHLKFIECVATFVDKAEDRGFEVLGLVSGGYSHIISCDPRREGVGRNAQPESVHRHTQQRQKFLIHLLHRWYITVNIFQGCFSGNAPSARVFARILLSSGISSPKILSRSEVVRLSSERSSNALYGCVDGARCSACFRFSSVIFSRWGWKIRNSDFSRASLHGIAASVIAFW